MSNRTKGSGTGSIGDRVWIDADGDGIQDARERGAAGVTVALIGAGADGKFGTADDVARTTTTDASGHYEFARLAAGNYQVKFGPLANHTYTAYHAGNNTAADSDANASGLSPIVTLGAGAHNTSIDAGLVRVPPPPPLPPKLPNEFSRIGDHVWLDTNGNGIQDAGEKGAAGVTVKLESADGKTVLGTAITDANGDYLFNQVSAGQYQVQFGTLPGYQFTTPHAGANTQMDSDAGSNGLSQIVTVGYFANISNIDAGLVHASSPPPPAPPVVPNEFSHLSGHVWVDENGNGIREAGEQGVAGLTVKLESADGKTVLDTVITDANGNYLFDHVPTGQVEVQFGARLGLQFTTPHVGADTQIDSDAGSNGLSQIVTVGPFANISGIDAGMILVPVPAAHGPALASVPAASQLLEPSNTLLDLAFGMAATGVPPAVAHAAHVDDGELGRRLAHTAHAHAMQVAA